MVTVADIVTQPMTLEDAFIELTKAKVFVPFGKPAVKQPSNRSRDAGRLGPRATQKSGEIQPNA